MPKVYNSIIVPAPVEQVWSRVRDFHDFSWAPSIVTACEKVGEGEGYSVGARRLLSGAFLDTLIAYSAVERRMMYSLDEGPSPVSSREVLDYVGTCICYPSQPTTRRSWNGPGYGSRKIRMRSST
jgi:hypothetical protein